MLLWLLAQQQVEPVGTVGGSLVQYGPVGILALVGLTAVGVSWKRISAIGDAERARADLITAGLDARLLIWSRHCGPQPKGAGGTRDKAAQLEVQSRERA